jgi:beta-galactosidase
VVHAFSNCDEVELFVNGKSQGRQAMPRLGHLEWSPKYEAGVLSAKGFKAGQLAVETVVATADAPARILLKPYKGDLLADNEDVVPVEVLIADAKGNVVPLAGNLVSFEISGPGEVAGVGNGDPSCHEADKASARSAFNGKCLVLVRAREVAGSVVLTARSKGLQSAKVTFIARTVETR